MGFNDGTKEIINVFYEVYNKLGFGFLEAVYEEAMAIEFRKRGMMFGRQVRIDVLYKGEKCKDYVVDFIVDNVVVAETVPHLTLRSLGESSESRQN